MGAATETDPIGLNARVPFDRLPFSRLFSDYCANSPDVWRFFPAGDSLEQAEERAFATAARRSADRSRTAAVLEEQNAAWGHDELLSRNLSTLAEPDSVCVVTGQQLGLFVSPLYTIYKAMTAIQLARKWADRGFHAVPVFWLAGEDHDFDEVASTTLPRGESLARVGLTVDDGRPPVGRRILDDEILLVQEALADVLPRGVHRADVLELVRSTYKVGVSHRDAFARLLRQLLPDSGIIIMSVDDRRFKERVAPLFVREVEEGKLVDLVTGRSGELEAVYHAQVKPRDTNLFYTGGDNRLAIDRVGERFLAGHDYTWSRDELVEEVRANPERFSPNVVLRPIVQDLLLPTASYVAGPGELAYFAQLGPAYEWAGVSMPFIKPRASITLVDNASHRLMDQRSLTLVDFSQRVEALFSGQVRDGMPDEIAGEFTRVSQMLDMGFDALKMIATGVEPTLDRSTESARTRAHKQVEKLLEKVERAERRKSEELRERIFRAHALLFPAGGMQERSLSPLYFVARYGLDFFPRLLDHVALDASDHQVLMTSDI